MLISTLQQVIILKFGAWLKSVTNFESLKKYCLLRESMLGYVLEIFTFGKENVDEYSTIHKLYT